LATCRASTKTRGERVQPAARPAGEGVYALVREGSKMHLAWALELPKKPGPVQEAFKIAQEASLGISIANPEKRGGPRTAQLGEEQKADYPKKLQEEFRDRKFATEDPRLLDFEGAQIILIGARTDRAEAYNIDLQPEQESASSADIFRQLRFAKSRHPVEPLLEGECASEPSRIHRIGVMRLGSDALPDGRMPVKYSKDGQNVSPPLAWSDLPAGTQELALLFENVTPQTKEPFVQWLVYGVPKDARGLPEGYKHKRDPKEPLDIRQGRNSLDNVDKAAFLDTIAGHVLEHGELLATYERLP
jgi:phosphatidylethanolamine-binding protein (PEBP) family uncharacterized protein